ncbi:hypothetical protein POTOM_025707 [Populus tomentosa]|uniref:Retrotransposon gag domain-containing protein n=1 Tax=Populus tomentosa TaxID=118781 RepID=A0A8X7ZJL3_POPTO|nr:hypothetical protein POTOM_025707 [Populus tomentosa]
MFVFRQVVSVPSLVMRYANQCPTPTSPESSPIVARERPNLCEENVVPLHIEPEDENEEGFGGEFKPRARNGVQQVERFLEIMRIEVEHKVDFIAYKSCGGAGAWWQHHQNLLRSTRQPPIRNWTQMKTLLKGRFLSLDYEQVFFQRLQNCVQDFGHATNLATVLDANLSISLNISLKMLEGDYEEHNTDEEDMRL